MRKLGWMLLLAGLVGCQKGGASSDNVTPQTDDQKILYSIGLALGQKVQALGLTADELQYVKAGFTAEALKQKPAVDLQEWGPKIEAFAQARGNAAAKVSEEKGNAYLAQAAQEKGAVKAPAGFVFISEKDGTGTSPQASDTVQVNYRGTLIDGTEFDSSYKRGMPATFALANVIPCWTQGIPLMKVGGKAKLVCPPNLAYGDRIVPGIPPGSTLIFEVELLNIQAHPAQAPAADAGTGKP